MQWWDYLYLNEGFATVSQQQCFLMVRSRLVALQLMGEVVVMDKWGRILPILSETYFPPSDSSPNTTLRPSSSKPIYNVPWNWIRSARLIPLKYPAQMQTRSTRSSMRSPTPKLAPVRHGSLCISIVSYSNDWRTYQP